MRFLSHAFWLSGLVLLTAGSLQANEALEQGIKAFDTEKFTTAFELWAPLARQDHAEAQLFMGVLYRYGLGVDRDQAKAAYWYERAANNGDVDAQGEIGMFYETGLGVKQDVWEANSWYQLVTERDVCLSDTLSTGRLLVKEKYR
jgi:TPR repeat protein